MRIPAEASRYGWPSASVIRWSCAAAGRSLVAVEIDINVQFFKNLEQGFQRAGDDPKLLAFGPIVLSLMREAGELAASTGYGR